jgi:lysophospholipase L1-like esterase
VEATPAVSAAALPETEDAGAEYIDGIYFLGDQALNALKDDGMLTGADARKQVWVPSEGRLPLQAIDSTTYHSPVTGNNAPAADIALVNKPAVILIFPSPDNGSMVTRDALIEAYTTLISAIQEQSPDTKIILSSLTPLAASYEYEDLTNEKIEEINSWIAAAAEDAGVKYLDAYDGLLNAQGYLSEEYHDGDAMHLNSEGMQTWLDYVRTHAYQ